MVNRFKVKAAALDAWGNARFNFMESDGLGEDIAAIEAKLKNHEAFEEDYTIQSDKLAKLETILEEIVAGGHSDAAWCQTKYAELGGLWGKLKARAEQRKGDLQAELDKQKQIQELLLTFAKKSTVSIQYDNNSVSVLIVLVRFSLVSLKTLTTSCWIPSQSPLSRKSTPCNWLSTALLALL